MPAYYNEIEPYAAAWLRNLIAAGYIADGVVDERSIVDVSPDDLRGFTQCHFFAGVGVWSYALRRAGWPDDRPIWTGSCPCQPFSAAGKGGGFTDERHLWPHFHWLIAQCRPDVVAGEQVASKDGLAWVDLVQADLEGAGYASGAVDLCAAGVGSPHIRQRLLWVGERLADADDERLEGHGRPGTVDAAERRENAPRYGAEGRALVGMADDRGRGREMALFDDGSGRAPSSERQASELGVRGAADGPRACSTNGHWRDADWLFCRDGKWRPVEPGTFPLAHGATSRVGRLRAYGNAIVAQCAEEFIRAYMTC